MKATEYRSLNMSLLYLIKLNSIISDKISNLIIFYLLLYHFQCSVLFSHLSYYPFRYGQWFMSIDDIFASLIYMHNRKCILQFVIIIYILFRFRVLIGSRHCLLTPRDRFA